MGQTTILEVVLNMLLGQIERLLNSGADGAAMCAQLQRSYLGKLFTIATNATVQNDDFVTERRYIEGDRIPTGKKVGDLVQIIKGAQVEITKTAVSKGKLVVFAKDYGWVSADNLEGKFYNETLEAHPVVWISRDDTHKTVGDKKAFTRKPAVKSYVERRPKRTVPKDTSVDNLKTSDDGAFVLIADTNGIQLGWTAISNLDTAPIHASNPNRHRVKDPDTRLRDQVVEYPSTNTLIPQGAFVIIKEHSQDTTPIGQYVRVASTVNQGNTWIEGPDLGWTAASNLIEGWADFKGPNAAWEKGNYIRQMDFLDIVGTSRVELYAATTLFFYLALKHAAAKAGLTLTINEGFRDFARQEVLRKQEGQGAAIPGFSDHQHGQAVDIATEVDRCSMPWHSPVYDWLKANARTHGFVRTVSTEPWHWEYKPADAAKGAGAGEKRPNGCH